MKLDLEGMKNTNNLSAIIQHIPYIILHIYGSNNLKIIKCANILNFRENRF